MHGKGDARVLATDSRARFDRLKGHINQVSVMLVVSQRCADRQRDGECFTEGSQALGKKKSCILSTTDHTFYREIRIAGA
jgi:hypothetical protein